MMRALLFRLVQIVPLRLWTKDAKNRPSFMAPFKLDSSSKAFCSPPRDGQPETAAMRSRGFAAEEPFEKPGLFLGQNAGSFIEHFDGDSAWRRGCGAKDDQRTRGAVLNGVADKVSQHKAEQVGIRPQG
jgi:hypothetical protein